MSNLLLENIEQIIERNDEKEIVYYCSNDYLKHMTDYSFGELISKLSEYQSGIVFYILGCIHEYNRYSYPYHDITKAFQYFYQALKTGNSLAYRRIIENKQIFQLFLQKQALASMQLEEKVATLEKENREIKEELQALREELKYIPNYGEEYLKGKEHFEDNQK